MAHVVGVSCMTAAAGPHARPIARPFRSQPVSAARPALQPARSSRRQQQRRLQVCAEAAASTPALADTQAQPVGNMLPGTPGVYAIYNDQGELQYVGLTRKINLSVATHKEALPKELVHSVKFVEVPGGDREALTECWKQWVGESVEATGTIPPGNTPGETKWQAKQRRAKAELRLTPGKGLQDLTCSVEDLIDAVVKTNKVVAFVKGTRTQPACGFSYRMLTILNEFGADYEVVNVLDEVYNPGVREAVKTYSQWPTIPQLYVQGEFTGGADIVEQMASSGELRKLLQQ